MASTKSAQTRNKVEEGGGRVKCQRQYYGRGRRATEWGRTGNGKDALRRPQWYRGKQSGGCDSHTASAKRLGKNDKRIRDKKTLQSIMSHDQPPHSHGTCASPWHLSPSCLRCTCLFQGRANSGADKIPKEQENMSTREMQAGRQADRQACAHRAPHGSPALSSGLP